MEALTLAGRPTMKAPSQLQSWWCRSGSSQSVKVGVYTMGTGNPNQSSPKESHWCNLYQHTPGSVRGWKLCGNLGPWGSHIHGVHPNVCCCCCFCFEFLIFIGTLQLSLIIHPEWFSICRLSWQPSLKTFLWGNSLKLQATDWNKLLEKNPSESWELFNSGSSWES